jgi:integrase
LATIKLYKKSKRQPCYRLSYRDPQTGKWRNKLLHCSRDQADQIRREVEAEYTWLDNHPELREGQSSNSRTVHQAIEEFKASKKGTVKPLTVDRYNVALTNFQDFYSGDVGKIDRHLIDQYRSKLLEDREGRGTNAELRHLKVFLRYSAENEWVKMPKITMAKENPIEVRWLSKEQVRKLREKIEILDQADRQTVLDIMDLLLQTGARANEIIESKWKQINLPRKNIKPDDKGNTGKPLFLDPHSVKILKKYKDNKPGPFQVNLDWFYWRYQKLATAAEIETTVHDLRRTCGAWLIQAGVDIYQVSKYLRHSSVMVTEKHYVDILPSDLSKIAAKIGRQIAK